jgi:hypothetical protein
MAATLAAGLIVFALFLIINPETRIFLLFIDSIGIDVFAGLFAWYCRQQIALTFSLLLLPGLRLLYRCGPVPGFWPGRTVLGSSAVWTGYALMVPALCAGMAALCVKCLIDPWI